MASPQAGGYQVRIDPVEWYRLKQTLDSFDKDLARALRRRLKNAGQVAADAVKKTLNMPSPDGGPDNHTGRDALAAATRVTVSFSKAKSAAGSKVRTSPSKLADAHKGLLSVYNMRTFRHPVFAGKGQTGGSHDGAWVEQEGRPYFYGPIQKSLDKELAKEIRAAVDEAVRAIRGKTR